ncbi:hypothetical protein HMI51_15910 [Corallococcus coralloides]|nr:hypothetical protein [Corallococcus coralloides]
MACQLIQRSGLALDSILFDVFVHGPVSLRGCEFVAIPPSLEGAVRLVVRTFLEGVTKDDYWPLLVVLNPYMSDRGMAMVVGHFVGRAYEIVLGDIYGIDEQPPPPAALEAVRARLVAAGLDEWIKAEE